jgi:hypothetical protein
VVQVHLVRTERISVRRGCALDGERRSEHVQG